MPILLVIGLGVLLALDVTILNAFLIALSFVWEIVFGILITIVQFVAIFWFMSRSRVERIRTMTVSTSRRSSDRGDGT